MKAFPWKCASCRERAAKQVVLPSYTAELEHDGRKYQIALTDLEVVQCEHCGAIVLDDVAEARLIDALRIRAGLLNPSEIRAKRESLSLTQKVLANLLGIADSTISRWETGAQIQQRSLDKFLRCFFELPDVRRFLGAPMTTWTMVPVRSVAVGTLPEMGFIPVEGRVSWGGGLRSIPSPTDSSPTPGPHNPEKLAA
jgi:putative zinc finger/helix-turn-helix YgiT family protein